MASIIYSNPKTLKGGVARQTHKFTLAKGTRSSLSSEAMALSADHSDALFPTRIPAINNLYGAATLSDSRLRTTGMRLHSSEGATQPYLRLAIFTPSARATGIKAA